MSAPWFPLRSAPPSARTRLLCLPCAGGGASMFREWQAALPDCEVLAAQLPGREHRIKEAPLRDLTAVVDGIEAAIAAIEPPLPLVLFGHSLGALIAFALARRLVAAGRPPRHVVVAGARAAHRPPRRILHDLPLGTLLDEVVRMGGTSPRVLAEPELIAMIEPALRADLWLAEHNVLAPQPMLPVPMTILGGTEDVQVRADDLGAWQQLTSAGSEVVFVRGGHFFVRDARAEVLQRLGAVLR